MACTRSVKPQLGLRVGWMSRQRNPIEEYQGTKAQELCVRDRRGDQLSLMEKCAAIHFGATEWGIVVVQPCETCAFNKFVFVLLVG